MNKLIFAVAFLFFGIALAHATPTETASVTCNVNSGTTCQGSVNGSGTLTVGSGHTVVVFAATKAGTAITFTIADTCGLAWTHQTLARAASGTSALVDAWTAPGGAGGTCDITVTRSTNQKFNWIALDYSGVGSIGNITSFTSGAATSCSISESTQDNNNVIVAGFVTGNVVTYTATSGTIRGQISTSSSSADTLGVLDNTNATPASVTNAVSYGTSGACAAGAIELRASGASGRAATDSDSGFNIRLTCGSACNYTLPGTPSVTFTEHPSSWWANVCGDGAQTYQIVVQSPATLNGGSTPIVVPNHQCLHVWTDGTNYHASPPFAAGTGLTLTPSATAITIGEDTTKIHTYSNTVRITADSSSITATTAGTATTIFTFPTLTANTNYSFHCSGTTTQATAGAGIGIAITAGTNAPTSLEARARVATSASASAYSSSGNITNTTATAVYTGSAGTVTTQLPWDVDGSIQVGASVPTLTIGFFSANASDAVTVKANSFCTIMP